MRMISGMRCFVCTSASRPLITRSRAKLVDGSGDIR